MRWQHNKCFEAGGGAAEHFVPHELVSQGGAIDDVPRGNNPPEVARSIGNCQQSLSIKVAWPQTDPRLDVHYKHLDCPGERKRRSNTPCPTNWPLGAALLAKCPLLRKITRSLASLVMAPRPCPTNKRPDMASNAFLENTVKLNPRHVWLRGKATPRMR